MTPGTIVKNKVTKKLGVVVTDPFDVCTDNEVPVVYEGTTASVGTDSRNLESLGHENAQADPKKCGAGQGENCCIFLTAGANGFECGRFGSIRWSIIFRKERMVAQRDPVQLFPNCQLG